MKYFVCIDDTDNYESIGTGELLENMMREAEIIGLAKFGFTVRYQLYIHDDIPYTSHNSSMCCTAETDNPDLFISFCEKYLEEKSAEGSDPGLCVLIDDTSVDYSPLIEFGNGGTGEGIIGALAGAALRAGKEEGRIKGKLQPLPNRTEWSLSEFSSVYGVQRFIDESRNDINEELSISFVYPTKLLYYKGIVTAVIVNENGRYIPKPKIKKNKEKIQ